VAAVEKFSHGDSDSNQKELVLVRFTGILRNDIGTCAIAKQLLDSGGPFKNILGERMHFQFREITHLASQI
jgi:hypothetical protein